MQFTNTKEEELKALRPVNATRRLSTDPLQDYYDDNANYARLFTNPPDTWAVPFVTGYRYAIRFGEALDFETMKMHLSDRWTTDDFFVLFYSKHVDVRE